MKRLLILAVAVLALASVAQADEFYGTDSRGRFYFGSINNTPYGSNGYIVGPDGSMENFSFSRTYAPRYSYSPYVPTYIPTYRPYVTGYRHHIRPIR